MLPHSDAHHGDDVKLGLSNSVSCADSTSCAPSWWCRTGVGDCWYDIVIDDADGSRQPPQDRTLPGSPTPAPTITLTPD
jgi:hypothetical protein